jgi:hypothetical protein
MTLRSTKLLQASWMRANGGHAWRGWQVGVFGDTQMSLSLLVRAESEPCGTGGNAPRRFRLPCARWRPSARSRRQVRYSGSVTRLLQLPPKEDAQLTTIPSSIYNTKIVLSGERISCSAQDRNTRQNVTYRTSQANRKKTEQTKNEARRRDRRQLAGRLLQPQRVP